MIHLIKISAISLLIILTQKANCQTEGGVQKITKTYEKVMAFTKQPFLHYTTVTTMNALPVFEQNDTATLTGEFYKCKDDFYSNNGIEETYVQDSFLIRVDHDRKSIWISKVDAATKKRMDMIPISFKQQLIKTYTISQSNISSQVCRMDFYEKQQNNTTATATSFALEYNKHSLLPTAIEIKVKIRQASDDALLAELDKEHLNTSKLFKEIDGVKFLVRTQQMQVKFSNIDNTTEGAIKMPSWKTVLYYDSTQNEFLPTAAYVNYMITPTF